MWNQLVLQSNERAEIFIYHIHMWNHWDYMWNLLDYMLNANSHDKPVGFHLNPVGLHVTPLIKPMLKPNLNLHMCSVCRRMWAHVASCVVTCVHRVEVLI